MQLQRINLSGTDCIDFLHRQLTADITALENDVPTLTAWCNIQGRVVALLWVTKLGADAVLDVPSNCYGKLMPRMKMFVMRDDVHFSEPETLYASINAETQRLETYTQARSDWEPSLIENGIPFLETETYEEFLPQMINLDILSGLSFSKGCYPGQEIVARTHFRGKLKQRMLRLKCDTPAGDAIYNKANSKAGKVIVSHAGECLAVVRLENLAEGLFDSKGEPLELLALPYLIPELTA